MVKQNFLTDLAKEQKFHIAKRATFLL